MKMKDESIENVYIVVIGKVNGYSLYGVNEVDVINKVSYNLYLKLVERSNEKYN